MGSDLYYLVAATLAAFISGMMLTVFSTMLLGRYTHFVFPNIFKLETTRVFHFIEGPDGYRGQRAIAWTRNVFRTGWLLALLTALRLIILPDWATATLLIGISLGAFALLFLFDAGMETLLIFERRHGKRETALNLVLAYLFLAALTVTVAGMFFLFIGVI